jgi:hypothetical protein
MDLTCRCGPYLGRRCCITGVGWSLTVSCSVISVGMSEEMPQTRRRSRRSHTRSTRRSGTVYETHDNGGRPFRVHDLGGSVVIHREGTDAALRRQPYMAIFPGRYPANWGAESRRHYPWRPAMLGNSVLLHVSGSKYMYIGESIWEFDTHGDRILDYYSPIGNSDVPYPFAVGERNTYLMTEKVFYPNVALDASVDPYAQHYGFVGPRLAGKRPLRVARLY